jgi:hypothetical protein
MSKKASSKSGAVYGRVSSVSFDSEKKDVFVNVVTGPNREPRAMPISCPRPGVWYVPKEGDMVEVHDINGVKTARFPANPPAEYELPEELAEGDVCFQLNENTKLHFSVQNDDTINVDIACDGELSITATEGFDVVDGDGYGVVSEDDPGVFKWYHEEVDFTLGPMPEPEE